MPVISRRINGSLYNDHAAVRHFSSRACFFRAKSKFCAFCNVNIDNTYIRRAMKTVVKSKSPKWWVMIASHSCINLFQNIIIKPSHNVTLKKSSVLYAAGT